MDDIDALYEEGFCLLCDKVTPVILGDRTHFKSAHMPDLESMKQWHEAGFVRGTGASCSDLAAWRTVIAAVQEQRMTEEELTSIGDRVSLLSDYIEQPLMLAGLPILGVASKGSSLIETCICEAAETADSAAKKGKWSRRSRKVVGYLYTATFHNFSRFACRLHDGVREQLRAEYDVTVATAVPNLVLSGYDEKKVRRAAVVVKEYFKEQSPQQRRKVVPLFGRLFDSEGDIFAAVCDRIRKVKPLAATVNWDTHSPDPLVIVRRAPIAVDEQDRPTDPNAPLPTPVLEEDTDSLDPLVTGRKAPAANEQDRPTTVPEESDDDLHSTEDPPPALNAATAKPAKTTKRGKRGSDGKIVKLTYGHPPKSPQTPPAGDPPIQGQSPQTPPAGDPSIQGQSLARRGPRLVPEQPHLAFESRRLHNDGVTWLKKNRACRGLRRGGGRQCAAFGSSAEVVGAFLSLTRGLPATHPAPHLRELWANWNVSARPHVLRRAAFVQRILDSAAERAPGTHWALFAAQVWAERHGISEFLPPAAVVVMFCFFLIDKRLADPFELSSVPDAAVPSLPYPPAGPIDTESDAFVRSCRDGFVGFVEFYSDFDWSDRVVMLTHPPGEKEYSLQDIALTRDVTFAALYHHKRGKLHPPAHALAGVLDPCTGHNLACSVAAHRLVYLKAVFAMTRAALQTSGENVRRLFLSAPRMAFHQPPPYESFGLTKPAADGDCDYAKIAVSRCAYIGDQAVPEQYGLEADPELVRLSLEQCLREPVEGYPPGEWGYGGALQQGHPAAPWQQQRPAYKSGKGSSGPAVAAAYVRSGPERSHTAGFGDTGGRPHAEQPYGYGRQVGQQPASSLGRQPGQGSGDYGRAYGGLQAAGQLGGGAPALAHGQPGARQRGTAAYAAGQPFDRF
eukprot:gene3241-5077_t